jgi:hypothetical protein
MLYLKGAIFFINIFNQENVMIKKITVAFVFMPLLFSTACTLPQNEPPLGVNENEIDIENSQNQPQPVVEQQDSPADQAPADQVLAEQSSDQPGEITASGETLTTYIDSDGIGKIAVQVTLPGEPRYTEGAGIVVEINTFLTPANRFYTSADVTAVGLIHVSYLWPGISAQGYTSDGEFDYGMETSIQALRDVIRFVTGDIPNTDGFYLADLIEITPLYTNVGLYAFSHPGQAAANVLGLYGDQISRVDYFVGRENPTMDKLTAVEVGYINNDRRPVLNPLYTYPADYHPRDIDLDYSSIAWDGGYTESGSSWVGVPYFDLNGSGSPDGGDHPLGLKIPAVDGKRVYSIELTRALVDNDAFAGQGGWPSDVAPLSLVEQFWSFNDSTSRYRDIGRQLPDLKVMLVFATYDHVQPAADKPHIHQAYDGYSRGAGLWVRLNPDDAYIGMVSSVIAGSFQEHDANTQPSDWLTIESWGHSNQGGAAQLVPLAAVAEMADRTQSNNWDPDLISVLFEYALVER